MTARLPVLASLIRPAKGSDTSARGGKLSGAGDAAMLHPEAKPIVKSIGVPFACCARRSLPNGKESDLLNSFRQD